MQRSLDSTRAHPRRMSPFLRVASDSAGVSASADSSPSAALPGPFAAGVPLATLLDLVMTPSGMFLESGSACVPFFFGSGSYSL